MSKKKEKSGPLLCFLCKEVNYPDPNDKSNCQTTLTSQRSQLEKSRVSIRKNIKILENNFSKPKLQLLVKYLGLYNMSTCKGCEKILSEMDNAFVIHRQAKLKLEKLSKKVSPLLRKKIYRPINNKNEVETVEIVDIETETNSLEPSTSMTNSSSTSTLAYNDDEEGGGGNENAAGANPDQSVTVSNTENLNILSSYKKVEEWKNSPIFQKQLKIEVEELPNRICNKFKARKPNVIKISEGNIDLSTYVLKETQEKEEFSVKMNNTNYNVVAINEKEVCNIDMNNANILFSEDIELGSEEIIGAEEHNLIISSNANDGDESRSASFEDTNDEFNVEVEYNSDNENFEDEDRSTDAIDTEGNDEDEELPDIDFEPEYFKKKSRIATAVYNCFNCLEVFKTKYDHDEHVLTHERDYRIDLDMDILEAERNETCFKCQICGSSQPTSNQLILHIRNFHTDTTNSKPKNNCDECNLAFHFKTHLKDHKESFHNSSSSATVTNGLQKNGLVPNLQCPKCPQLFYSKLEILEHLKYHKDDTKLNNGNLAADLADFDNDGIDDDVEYVDLEPEQEEQLEVQVLEDNMEEEEEDKDDPDFTVNNLPKVSTASSNNGNPNKIAHMCDICDKIMANAASLKMHLYTHDPTRTKDNKCELCSKSFYWPYELKRHMKNAHTTGTPKGKKGNKRLKKKKLKPKKK